VKGLRTSLLRLVRSLYVPELLLDGQGSVESNAVDREHEQPAASASFDPTVSPEYDHIARRLRTLEQCALREWPYGWGRAACLEMRLAEPSVKSWPMV
jgi:hypothetical protein